VLSSGKDEAANTDSNDCWNGNVDGEWSNSSEHNDEAPYVELHARASSDTGNASTITVNVEDSEELKSAESLA
jgi:hypothetical protein